MTGAFGILDHVPLGIAVLGRDLRVLAWNACMEDWTGVGKAEAEGRALDGLYPRFADPRYRSRLDLLLEGGPPVIFSYQLNGCLFPHRDPARGERVQHVTATTFSDPAARGNAEDGDDRRILLSVEDRTEVSLRVRAARAEVEKRRESEEELRRALAEKVFLMKEIDHRVKNNLAMVLGVIELQKERAGSLEHREDLEDLGGRIRSFVALHEALYRGPSARWVRADEYLDAVLLDFFETLEKPGCRAVLEIRAEPVRLDVKTALYAALVAVEGLTNAMKHATAGRTEASIRIALERTGDGSIELRVEDDGPGFTPGRNPLDSDSLGLKLARMLAEELGGGLAFGPGPGARLIASFSTGTAPNEG